MEQISYNISLLSYFAASLGYFVCLIYRNYPVSIFARITVAFGAGSQIVFMGIRSSQTGHGPYTNSFEVAFFCSWIVVLSYFIAELRYKIKGLGAFVIPLAFLILLYSFFLQFFLNNCLSRYTSMISSRLPQSFIAVHSIKSYK